MGTGGKQHDAVCGRFGIPKRTKMGIKYGRQLHACGLTSAATLFRKSPRGRWPEGKFDPKYHPGGRRETAHDTFTSRFGPQQLDHLFVSTKHKAKVRDSAAANWGVRSDHRLVHCELEVQSSVATYRYGTDLTILNNPKRRQEFLQLVESNRQRLQAVNAGDDSPLALIYMATQQAAASLLKSKVNVRARWFEASKEELLPLVARRNASSNAKDFGQARKELVAAKKRAKAKWHALRVRGIEKKKCDEKDLDPKQVWALVYETAEGADAHGRRSTTKIQFNKNQAAGKAGGVTETAEEAAKVCEAWAEKMFDKDGEHTAVHELMEKCRQRSPNYLLEKRPTEAEIRKAVRGLGNGKSGGAAKMPAEHWKAFEHDDRTKQYIRDHVLNYWDRGRKQPPAEPPQLDPDPEPPLAAARPSFTLHPPPPARRCRRCALEVLDRQGQTPRYETTRAPLAPLPHDHASLACACADPSHHGCCREYIGCTHTAHRGASLLREELSEAGLKTAGGLPQLRQRVSDLRRENARARAVEDDEIHDCPGCLCSHSEWEDAVHPAPRQGVHGEERGFCYPEWLQAQVILLYKKGDRGQCKNWRAINLLDIASKVL